MRLIIFSDAHGNQHAVRKFFYRINAMPHDKLIFLGDVMGYYYGSEEILSAFRFHNIVSVLGNHDQMYLDMLQGKIEAGELIKQYGNSYNLTITPLISVDNLKYLQSLNMTYELKINGKKMAFVHGTLNNPLNGRIYPDTKIMDDLYHDFDYVICGHTHHKMVRHLNSGTVMINPGSIGQQRDGKGCSYLVFDTIEGTWHFEVVEYGVNLLIRDIAQRENNDIMKTKLTEVLLRNKM